MPRVRFTLGISKHLSSISSKESARKMTYNHYLLRRLDIETDKRTEKVVLRQLCTTRLPSNNGKAKCNKLMME